MLLADGIFTESVEGKQVKTTEAFLSMKQQLEQTINKYQTKVVNTTIGGAKIEGTRFKTLVQMINEELSETSVRDYPLSQIKQTKKYDQAYAHSQLEQLKGAYQDYQKLVSGIKGCLLELHELTRMNQGKEAHQVHVKMDRQIMAMEENAFFKMIALPINRVEYGMLVNDIQQTKAEKNNLRKAKSAIKPTESFINLLHTEMNSNNEIMEVLKNVVREFA